MTVLLLCAIALLGLVAYLARDQLATRVAGVVLDRKSNLRCSHPELDVAPSLKTIVAAPVDCEVFASPFTEFRTTTPMTIELGALRPRSIRVQRAELDQRARDISHVDMDTTGDIADALGVIDSMVKNMLDSAAMYRKDMPYLLVDVLTTRRDNELESTMIRFRKSMDGPWNRTQADRVIAAGGSPVTVADMDMRVTETRARCRVDIYLGKREAGDTPDIKLAMVAEHLNTKTPKLALEIL